MTRIRRSDRWAWAFAALIWGSGSLLPPAQAANGVPALLPFQGRLTETNGVPINYEVSVAFRIYPADGSCYLYEETHASITPNNHGMFSVMLGLGQPSGSPANSFVDVFNNDPSVTLTDSCAQTYVPAPNEWRRLEIIVDGTPMTGMQTIGAAAFAFNAQSVEGKRSADFAPANATVGGDVSGTLTSVSVDKLKGYSLNFSTLPTNGQILVFDSATSSWAPGSGGAGSNGATGATGATGAAGSVGAAGAVGATGATGAAGSVGAAGAAGATGATGAAGSVGAAGAAGATGATGAEGVSPFTGSGGNIYYNLGNVGIGTTAPGYELEVNGTINAASILVNGQELNGTNGTDGATGPTGATGADGSAGAAGANGSTGATGATGADGSAGAAGANGSTGATGATGSNGSAGAAGATGATGASGASPFTLSGTVAYYTGGNVGIGTTAPSEALEVNGKIKASTYLFTSDRRLKENIQSLDGTALVQALRGVSFDWKQSGEHELGLIAQEVESVAPDLVVTDHQTGLKAVKYANIVAPLIEAVKDLLNRDEKNQQELQRLRNELERLKKEIEKRP